MTDEQKQNPQPLHQCAMWLVAAVLMACLGLSGCQDDATTEEATADTEAREDAEVSTEPYKRACQPRDVVCNDYACSLASSNSDPVLLQGECYLECETNADCTEPQRPFCTLVGFFDGGDYACNKTVMLCLREQLQSGCR